MLKYKFLKLGPNMRLVGYIAIISLPVQKYIQYLQYLPWPCNIRNFGAICAKEGLFTLGRFQTWIKPRISVHTSRQYHLYILSTRASVALNSPAPYSRMDSDWVSVFIVHQLEKIVLKVIPMISFLCAFIVIVEVWIQLFINTENNFFNYL